MERKPITDDGLEKARATEEWFRDFIYDEDMQAGRIPHVSENRLRLLYGTGNPKLQMRRAVTTLFTLPDSDMQGAFAMYLCGYGEETIGAVALGDLDETLGQAREIIGPLPSKERTRRVGRRAVETSVRADGFQSEDVPDPLPDSDEDELLTGVRLTDDPVRDYMRKMAKYRLLNAHEEVELAISIEAGVFAAERLDQEHAIPKEEAAELKALVRAGNRANSTMINANLRLVISIAKKYQGHGMPFLDLIQEGNLGLNKAVQMFDYQKGFKFSTYASWWIRQSVTRALADQSRLIRLPVHTHEKIAKIRREREIIVRETGIEPKDEEMAALMGMDIDKFNALMSAQRHVTSLNTKVGDDSDTEFGDLIADRNAGAIDEAVTEEFMKAHVLTLLHDVLDARDARIIEARYGINGIRKMSYDELSAEMGISRQGVMYAERSAMDKLRSYGSLYTRFADYMSA